MQSFQRMHSIILCGQLVTAVWYLAGVPVHAEDKVPVPSAAAQDKALALVKDVYGEEYAKAESSEEKTAFAEKLLQTAKGTNQGTANHYALLRVAWDVATQAGDAKVALQVTDAIAGVYEVNALSAKVATVKITIGFARTSTQNTSLSTVALEVVDEAVADDDYDRATELTEIALAAARKARDWQLVKQIAARDKTVKEMAEAHAKAQEALATLESNPTDPAANQAVGEYFCFVKGDWGKGIPMLALGSDEALRTLAQKDLKGASLPNEQVELGDGWWELAHSHKGERREMLLLRAGNWYDAAKAGLSTGLTLAKVEKRLEEIEKIGRPAPKAPTAAKAPKPRLQLPEGSVLLMTFEPDTFTSKNGQVYVADMSGFGNHGIVTGATQTPTGRAGAALQFSGQDTVLLPTLRTYLARQLKQLSISVWVAPTDIKGFRFIFDVGKYGWTCISLFCRDGRPTFYLADRYGGGACISDKLEPTGQWHHVVAVWNGTEQRIYVDAKVKARTPTQGLTLNPTTVSAEPARLGAQAKSDAGEQRHFIGVMDEVAVFARALSEEEIQTLYQMGLDGRTLAKPGRTGSAR